MCQEKIVLDVFLRLLLITGMKLQSAFKEIFIQVIQAKNLLKKDT